MSPNEYRGPLVNGPQDINTLGPYNHKQPEQRPAVEQREDRFADTTSLVPYVVLRQKRDGKPNGVVIGNTRAGIGETGYGRNEIMGLQNVEIKYGMGFITVDVSFPIHQDMIRAAEVDKDSEVASLFDLGNRWLIEFGWGNTDPYKIDEMMLADWSLDYDQSLRSFIGKFKLVPKHSFILADIKVFMLVKEIKEIRTAYNKRILEELSIGSVVSKILDGCVRVINEHGAEGTIKDVPVTQEANNQSVDAPFELPLLPYQPREETENKESWWRRFKIPGFGTNKDGTKEDQVAMVSETFMLAKPEDVPKPEDIRIMLFGDKGLTPTQQARAFRNSAMQSDATLQKLTVDSNKDMNVNQFITSLLRDNGYSWMPSLASINDKGTLQWIILQSNFNNMDDHVEEVEVIGIRPQNDTEITKEKLINTWGEKNKKTAQLFDLHSNRNVVISVNASTDQGRSTIATAQAAEAIANANTTVPADEVNQANKNRMYAYLAQQAKEINLEILGFPEIKIGDNIFVNLAGDLYSGKYKIIEMDHKIGDNFITNLRAIRTLSGVSPPKDSNDQDGELPSYLQPKEVGWGPWKGPAIAPNETNSQAHQRNVTQQRLGPGMLK